MMSHRYAGAAALRILPATWRTSSPPHLCPKFSPLPKFTKGLQLAENSNKMGLSEYIQDYLSSLELVLWNLGWRQWAAFARGVAKLVASEEHK